MGLEVSIAIGIGLWFVLCGIASYIHISKSFKNSDKEDKK